MTSENGPYVMLGAQQNRRRTLEVLLPHLERAAEAPFEDQEIQIELANFANGVRNTLQSDV